MWILNLLPSQWLKLKQLIELTKFLLRGFMVNQKFKQGLTVLKHLVGTNKSFLIFLVYLYISYLIMKCHIERSIQDFLEKLFHRKYCLFTLFWNASQNTTSSGSSGIASSSCKEQQSQYFLNYWLTICENDCMKYSIIAFCTNYMHEDLCVCMKHLHSTKAHCWRQRH